MAFNGAGTRFISACVIPTGEGGGTLMATVAVQPLGSYPALGEPLAALLLLLAGKVKVAAGVQPDNVFISGVQTEGIWIWDPVQKTFRNFSALTPTEHATGVYSAPELAGVLRFTFLFPWASSQSR